MSELHTLPCRSWFACSPAALALAGLGLAGISGCSTHLTPSSRSAVSISQSAEQRTADSGNTDDSVDAAASEAQDPPAVTMPGRIFAAIINRFPSRERQTQDPFLDEPSTSDPALTAPHFASSQEPDPGTDESTASVSTRVATRAGRDRLRDSFDRDISTDIAPDAPYALVAQQRPSAEALSEDSLPEWARPTSSSVTGEEHKFAANAAHDLPTSHDGVVVTQVAATDSRDVDAPAESDAIHENEADADRENMERLMTRAREQEQRGLLRQALQSAVEAQAIAERSRLLFERHEEQPSQMVQRLQTRLESSTFDPFVDSSSVPSGRPPHAGTSPFEFESPERSAATFASQAQTNSPAALASTRSENRPPEPATAFPPVHEWKSVQANSPVSLAVVEQNAAFEADEPSPVRHAIVEESSTEAPSRRREPRSDIADSLWTWHDRPLTGKNVAVSAQVQRSQRVAEPAVIPTPQLPLEPDVQPSRGPSAEEGRSIGWGRWLVAIALLAAGVWGFLGGDWRSLVRRLRMLAHLRRAGAARW